MCLFHRVIVISLAVPQISWSFLCETRRQEKETYYRLVKKSSIWVDKEKLASVKDKSSSVKKYARALMWKVLITANDLLEILGVKEAGIGFAKMIGKTAIEDIYGRS